MNLRDVKLLAAGIVGVSLVTTNFIVPQILADFAPTRSSVRITAISTPEPIATTIQAPIPEPVRALSPAQATAKAAERQAHAQRILAENGELSSDGTAVDQRTDGSTGDASSVLKCLAGCD